MNTLILNILFFFSWEYYVQVYSDSICWKADVKLVWSDFQGVPDSTSTGKAGCAASLEAKGFWDGLPNFTVSNCFQKSISWTTDTTSVNLLAHEQLHFDIAEIHARLLRKSIDSLRKKDVSNVDVYSNSIQSILGMRNIMDSLYDKQTSHGILFDMQKHWESKVWKKIGELDEYGLH